MKFCKCTRKKTNRLNFFPVPAIKNERFETVRKVRGFHVNSWQWVRKLRQGKTNFSKGPRWPCGIFSSFLRAIYPFFQVVHSRFVVSFDLYAVGRMMQNANALVFIWEIPVVFDTMNSSGRNEWSALSLPDEKWFSFWSLNNTSLERRKKRMEKIKNRHYYICPRDFIM